MPKMTEIKEEPKKEAPPEPARKGPRRQKASLMDIARTVFWVTLVMVILAILAGLSWVAYLEFYIIPSLLIRQYGNGAILVHVFAVAGLMAGSAALAGWLQRRGIFQTHEKLMAAHINSTLSAIENLATGRWASDSYTHKEAFKTGAVLGYKMGQALGEPELDRNLIVEGIGRMSLPAGQQVTGYDTSVVDEMSGYFDEISARKQRLSG